MTVKVFILTNALTLVFRAKYVAATSQVHLLALILFTSLEQQRPRLEPKLAQTFVAETAAC